MADDDKPERMRLGRQRRKATEAVDAIDMAEDALEATEETMGPPDPAVLLVEAQRKLIRAQLSNERMGFVLRSMTALVGLGVAVGLSVMVWTAAHSRAVVIDAFDTPLDLSLRGQTGQVVARQVYDVISAVSEDAKSAAGDRAVALSWTRDTAVVVPSTNVSISDIEKLLRGWLGKETHIGGALTVDAGGRVSLTIRADRVRSRTFTGTEEQLPQLIDQASKYIFGQFEPAQYAWYLLQTDRLDEAQTFIAEAYAQHPDQRAELAYAWGVALATAGRPQEAIEKLRLTLRADPTNPNAQDMVIGTLFDTEGEEAAYRAGRELLATPAGRESMAASSSFLILQQDWTRVIELALKDQEESGGAGAVGGQEVSLADAEGRRHGYPEARAYLLTAVAGDPLAAVVRQMIDAYDAIERGDGSAALATMRIVDAAYRANEEVAFTFYEAPCYLGLSEGMNGRWREAEAAFARGSRYAACAAFRADVLEMKGDRAAADAAYGAALRAAPSLPLAYERRGATLLARGDAVLAAARFAQAHERAPRWADPLKGWGDALAAQGKWAEAAARYAEAEAFAPNWRALHLAHATALERLGKGREAEAERAKAR